MSTKSADRGAWLRAGRLAFSLQLGRRAGLLIACDLALLTGGIIGGLLGGGEPQLFYIVVIIVPVVFLGLAALADLVDLERRAGSLDLALALPRGERYFATRAAAVCVPLAVQSVLALTLLWILEGGSFALVPPLVEALLLVGLVGSSVLFWALRFASPGAVWIASLAELALLGPWALAAPIPPRGTAATPFFGSIETMADTLANALVVGCACALLVLAVRRRFARPERILMDSGDLR